MSERLTLPVLPLREVVLFPGVTAPIGAGRPATLRAIEAALSQPDRLVFAVSQRQNVESVTPEVLYTIGTIARIGQLQRGLSGMQLLLHGERRGIAIHYTDKDGYLQAIVREAEEMAALNAEDPAFVALHREARTRAAELGQKSGLPDEVVQQVLAGVNEPGKFADLVAGYIDITPPQRQMLLETLSVEERLRRVLVHVQRQIGVLDAQEDIKSQVQEELGERQREMFLREQLKTIQRELGEDDERDDLRELREKLAALELPAEARKEVDRELGRLARIGRESMESQVIRTFLENIAELPWNTRSEEHLDLPEAQRILDEDHYALGDVKDRVLEFLAVRQLRLQRKRRTAETRRQTERASGNETEAGSKSPPVSPTDTPAATATVPPPNAPIPGNDDDRRPGPDPAVRRPSRRRQDLGGQVHRPRDGAEVRPHLAGRRPRRGRHPRPPAHLRRRDAGPHHPGDEAGRHQEPGLPAGRGGQAGRLVPGRSGERAARGARSGAERHLHGPLPRRAVRPERGAVHRHGELHPEHPGPVARPDGGGGVRRLHRAGEAGDRPEVPHPPPVHRERRDARSSSRSPTRRCPR